MDRVEGGAPSSELELELEKLPLSALEELDPPDATVKPLGIELGKTGGGLLVVVVVGGVEGNLLG